MTKTLQYIHGDETEDCKYYCSLCDYFVEDNQHFAGSDNSPHRNSDHQLRAKIEIKYFYGKTGAHKRLKFYRPKDTYNCCV